VVIDVLRATTTMAVMFHRGLESLLAVEDIEAAHRAREASSDALLFGERHGLKPEGFDYGNSPAEAAALDLHGRHAIHATTNGTRALCAVAGGQGVVVAAALVNASAVAEFSRTFESVTLVCAGNGGANQFSLEDYATAATIAQDIHAHCPDAELGDGALLSMQIAEPAGLVARGTHADVLREFGFDDDLEFALRKDEAGCVPVVRSCGPGWAVLERA
jgi:2-phosphosulfolactate phosphatase